ncbi:hypothetical protein FDP41_006153 [Naegleria fowleri]|uniref:Uncharacterized protein n=1 Tax=Naegleria fowleri TaxID=5763 RepID=A0A6A5BP35_NAEFO|nr:uncharacterized protein FDP41_006153 [Naegleria fowleri]KAF0974679.1 hypothetical protein FDP41_006153 [Naegleria fowleri]CAG4718499.1 unnamed protein product [Naegleria fowleri]
MPNNNQPLFNTTTTTTTTTTFGQKRSYTTTTNGLKEKETSSTKQQQQQTTVPLNLIDYESWNVEQMTSMLTSPDYMGGAGLSVDLNLSMIFILMAHLSEPLLKILRRKMNILP